MSVYDINEIPLDTVYDINGTSLEQAYNIIGEPLLDDGTANVMTFNIQRWEGINSNVTLMNSIFNAYQPILVCSIQETGSNGTLNYVGTQFQTGKAMESSSIPNKTAFLFNTSYTDYSEVVYSTNSGETRGYQKCFVSINGKSVALYNTHLEPYNASIRTAQMTELLADIAQENYFIAMGDYNFIPNDYNAIAKPCVDAGYNLANWTSVNDLVLTWFNGTTVDGSTEKYPHDNIIVSSNITINSVTYDQRKITAQTGQIIDHIPIIVNLTVN